MEVRHVPSDVAWDDSWPLLCLNTQVSSGINTRFIYLFIFHSESRVILTANSEFQVCREKANLHVIILWKVGHNS